MNTPVTTGHHDALQALKNGDSEAPITQKRIALASPVMQLRGGFHFGRTGFTRT